MTTTPRPLKRHETLQPLSREHMSGLVLARNLRTLAAEGEERMGERGGAMLRQAWESELAPHFADEERILLGLVDADSGKRLVHEHRELARRICGVIQGSLPASAAELVGIADLLETHIRWEERSLFEEAQASHADALQRLHAEAERMHHERPASRPRTRLDWS